ncbi:hypothetical protein [Rickettsiella endosymbiont of Xylota segnis]|uniref:hypothetical protein n=1 Tax=Rickettsiella endosymbiont of Xylota segnis TaxID=3066238 RepID=UPI0030CAE479
MAIPVQQFPILSSAQANPLGRGLATGQNLAQHFIQNHFLKTNEQENLQKQQLANALSHIQLQFAPETMQTKLAYQSAQIPYLQAQTEKTKQATQLAPLDALIKAQQASQIGSRFGGAYQMARALQAMAPAARQIWIAQNQDHYNQMLVDLGNQTNSNFINPELLKRYLPELNNNSPRTLSPRFSQQTSDNIRQTQLANQLSANNVLTTPATRRQYEGGIQVEGIFNDPSFQSQAQNASLYAGATGKGKAALAALSQTNPKAYEDYIAFKRQTLPLIESRIKTLDQMGATDAQRKILENMFDKTADALTSNPQQFILQLNQLGKTLNLVARSVQTAASPLTPMQRIKAFNPIQDASKTINGKTYHKIQGQWYEQ